MSLRYTIITGASGAMGSEAAAALARAGRPVIMACRDLDKAQAVRSRILDEVPDAVLEIKHLELSSLDEVREFAQSLRGVEISALFNNAGTMERHFSVTGDGFERTLAVNYLASCLLTRLLLPQIRDGVLNMVSISCETARFDHQIFAPDASRFTQLGSYSTSKLALMLFSIALSQRCSLRVNVSDPGIVNTEMIRLHRWFDPLTDVIFRPFCNSPKKGAAPGVRALLSSEGSGLLYKGLGAKPIPSKYASRTGDIGWLWEESERILKGKGFLI
jgi:NAD(P)-dependent dehydrogenase (short-subunit alcohol dehydrogenase family)